MSDDAKFEALEASFVSGELNELTMSAMQQALEAPCHSQLYTITPYNKLLYRRHCITVGVEHAYGDCVRWNRIV